MLKNSTLHKTTTEVAGIYLNKYQEIVKPNQRFLVSNYFIHYWLRKLGPTLAWIIVSLQQACWRTNDDTCTISQTAIGDEVGLTDRTIRKVLKKNSFRHWFIPEIQYQPGNFNSKKKVYQPLPNKYTIYLASPLIPEHLAGLYGYLQTTCSAGQADSVDQAISDLLNRKSKESLVLLEEHAQTLRLPSGQTVEHIFDRPIPLTEVVTMATGLDFKALPQATAKKLNHNLDKLQVHLTEIGSTICRQYFRLTWIPLLGTSLAWLVMVMRSRCYYNPETEELRDTYTWQKKELAESLGQSTKNLSNLLSHPYANLFCQILERNKRKFTVKVSMVYEPMAPKNSSPGYSIDLAPFNYDQDKQDVPPDENGHGGQTLSQENQKKVPATSPRNRKIVPVTTSQNQKKVPSTTSQNRKIVPITKSETEKSSEHAPLNQKKVPTFKYSKESVSIVNKEQEGIEQNSIVVNAKVLIKELLSIAGLSGMGLSKLCDRQPPLDRQQVKAVILYAEANELGPGYIYNHLEQNGCVVDEEFLQFAALGDEGLALFQEAVRELKINGTLVAEIRTPIPESAFDLFARFAEVFTGIEAATVAAILRRRQHPQKNTHTGESVFGKAGPIDEPTGVASSSEADMLDRFWQQALGQLQLQMTQGTFDSWVRDTELIARDGLRFTVAVKNGFAKDWLENRLFTTIHRTIANLVRDENNSVVRLSNGQKVPDIEIDFVVND